MRDDPKYGRLAESQTSDCNNALQLIQASERRRPEIALILGSGLGRLADDLEHVRVFPTDSLPGYPESSVQGHDGQLVIGELEGVVVAVVRGRVHCYEGYDAHTVSFPVRLVHALGARRLIVTNAAGGIGKACKPGSIMLISDHLNMAFRHSIRHDRSENISMGDSYCPRWLQRASELAADLALPVSTGVYIWTLGPSYETKAEIAFFAKAGADAVGMSTVPEVLQANVLRMDVLGISTITNAAAGLHEGLLSHEDVLAVGDAVHQDVRQYIHRLVQDHLA